MRYACIIQAWIGSLCVLYNTATVPSLCVCFEWTRGFRYVSHSLRFGIRCGSLCRSLSLCHSQFCIWFNLLMGYFIRSLKQPTIRFTNVLRRATSPLSVCVWANIFKRTATSMSMCILIQHVRKYRMLTDWHIHALPEILYSALLETRETDRMRASNMRVRIHRPSKHVRALHTDIDNKHHAHCHPVVVGSSTLTTSIKPTHSVWAMPAKYRLVL